MDGTFASSSSGSPDQALKGATTGGEGLSHVAQSLSTVQHPSFSAVPLPPKATVNPPNQKFSVTEAVAAGSRSQLDPSDDPEAFWRSWSDLHSKCKAEGKCSCFEGLGSVM